MGAIIFCNVLDSIAIYRVILCLLKDSWGSQTSYQIHNENITDVTSVCVSFSD